MNMINIELTKKNSIDSESFKFHSDDEIIHRTENVLNNQESCSIKCSLIGK